MSLRVLAAVACAIAVSGCQTFESFLPSYDEALFRTLSDVNVQLDKIDAVVVVAEPAASFDKVEDYYVAAIADLSQARRIADGQSVYYAGRVAGRPADLIVRAIDNCNTLVIAQLRRHQDRERPMTSQLLGVLGVHEACSVPVLMVGRLKGRG